MVLRMDGQVQTHELSKLGVVEPKHVSQIVRPVLGGVDGSNNTILECVAVDVRGNDGKLGNQVHAILIGVLPILGLTDQYKTSASHLVHSGSISHGELALRLQCAQSRRELAHGVHVLGEACNEIGHVLGDASAGGPLTEIVS